MVFHSAVTYSVITRQKTVLEIVLPDALQANNTNYNSNCNVKLLASIIRTETDSPLPMTMETNALADDSCRDWHTVKQSQ